MVVQKYSLAKDKFKVLGRNFQVGEFACKDGSDTVLIDDALVVILQKIRDKFQKPVAISSAYRTLEYNRKIGSGDYSLHPKGMAADIHIDGVDPLEIARFAESIGVKGVGYYPPGDGSFCHVDTRVTKYYWIKKNGREIPVTTHGAKEEEEMPEIKNLEVVTADRGMVTVKAVNIGGENYVRFKDGELYSPIEVGFNGKNPTVKIVYKR